MELNSALALSVGPAIAKAILKVWLKDREILASIGGSLIDLVSRKTTDEFAKKKAERQFQDIGDKVAQSLVPLFESDGAALDEGGKIAVANAVAHTLENTPITAQFLLDRKLDPSELAAHFLQTQSSATIGLSASETALYERTLTETSRYVVDMASQLPAFNERTFAELIKRNEQLVEVANRILDEVKKIQLSSASSNPEHDASRFETEYRLAVGRKLDELELFGVDLNAKANRRHRLSVAYVSLEVRKQQNQPTTHLEGADRTEAEADGEHEAEDTVSVNEALQASNRLVVRGQAGSGKTTLLQWVAVKAASSAFEAPLQDWNTLIPFYIRLRDRVDKGLPRPEEFPGLVAPSISGLMPSSWVHEKLKAGMGIVLVDGVDEMRESQRADVRTWLKELSETFPQSRIIVSSRPTAIKDGWMDAEGFGDAELQPMDMADIFSFIDHWHSAVREELQDDAEIQELVGMNNNLKQVVRNTPAIRSLTTNPLLCAMLCALNRDRRQNLPSDRIELYEACCHMLAERRDKERQVTLQDYPQLSYRQKRPLLEDLAYWLITNDWSVVPRARAEERLSKRLANMPGLPHGLSGADVIRLFVDRTGLLREPQPSHIDFTHRTFQEFFAAKAALDEGDIGLLLQKADDDMWREVIILAAGLASPKMREELIKGLIKKGDDDQGVRHSVHLLAVSCLETSVELEPDLLKTVEARLKKLVPPKNMSEARGLASAGDLAVPHLCSNHRFYAIQKAFCIRALALIATDNALEALASYGNEDLQTVMTALSKAWNAFDREVFAKRIFSQRTHMSFNRMTTLAGFEHCTHLEHLYIWDAEGIRDLTPISKLQRLRQMRLHNCWRVTDLKPLSSASALETIWFSGIRLDDLSPLADLPHLKSVHVDFLAPNAIIPNSLKDKVNSTPFHLAFSGIG